MMSGSMTWRACATCQRGEGARAAGGAAGGAGRGGARCVFFSGPGGDQRGQPAASGRGHLVDRIDRNAARLIAQHGHAGLLGYPWRLYLAALELANDMTQG